MSDWRPRSATAWMPKSAVPVNTRTIDEPEENHNLDWARGGVNAIPPVTQAIGAGLGATAATAGLGPEAAPGGMILGGGAGKQFGTAIKQLVERIPALGMNAPQTPGDAMKEIGAAGSEGQLSETLGLPLGLAMGKLAPAFTEAGSGATKALKQEFKGVNFGKAMLDNGVRTADEAAALLKSRGLETQAKIGAIDAAAGGPHISAEDMAQTAIESVRKSYGRTLTQAEHDEIVDKVRDAANEVLAERRLGLGAPKATPASKVLGPNGQPATPAAPPQPQDLFTLSETKQIAQSAQDAVRGALKGEGNLSRNFNASPSVAKALEKGSTAAKNLQPGLAESEQRTREALALARALSGSEAGFSPLNPGLIRGAATGTGMMLGGLSHGGNPVENAAIGGTLANLATAPPALRGLGFLLNDPKMQIIASQWPGGVEAFLRATMQQQPAH